MKAYRDKIREVQTQLQDWSKLRSSLEEEYEIDVSELIDSLDGETNLQDALLEIDAEILEREMMAEAIAGQITVLEHRKIRVEKTTETLRNIILRAMDISGLPSIKGQFSTISVKYYEPEIKIEDESVIPANFWVAQEPKLDKKSLKDAVKEGQKVPGIAMSNGKIGLTIRRK